MKVVRSLAAIAAGYLFMAGALRLIIPSEPAGGMNYLLLSLGGTVFGALIAGFLTAWIAGYREIPHASGLGFILIAMSIVSMRQRGITQPGWYETTIAGCGPIAAMIGAAIRLLTKRHSVN